MKKYDVQISYPLPGHRNIRTHYDASEVHVHFSEDEEIRLSDLLVLLKELIAKLDGGSDATED